MLFHDRVDAGRQLADALRGLRERHPVVLGLPRGGVPVAAEVARALDAPLDVVLVRKLGLPAQPEVAMGAIGEGGVRVIDQETVRAARVTPGELAAVEETAAARIVHSAELFRPSHAQVPLAGRLVLVVDDGIATGATARAACLVVRAAGAGTVVLAAPVAAPDAVRALRSFADDVVVLEAPPGFGAVGSWYADFRPTSDDEVVRLLQQAAARTA